MQKKIFTSLLLSPLAFGALADINVADLEGYDGLLGEKWTSNSVTGETLLKTDGNKVTGYVGVGTIKQGVNVPCAGTYQVEFATSDKLSVVVTDATKFEYKDGVVTFVAPGKGKVTFEVASENAAQGFVFTTGELKIQYNFAAENAKMTAALKAVAEIPAITANPDAKVYPDAAKLKTTLEGERAAQIAKASNTGAIQKKIDAIVETGDAAKDLKTYEDNLLYADPNKIQAEINGIAAESKIISDKIKNFNTNFPALVGLDGGFKTLEDAWKVQNGRIAENAVKASPEAADLVGVVDDKGVDLKLDVQAAGYVNGTCSKAVNDAKTALDTYKAAIAAAYATDKLTTEVKFAPKPDAAALQAQITALTGTINTAYQSVADYAAVYGKTGLIASIKKLAKDAQNTVLDIKSVATPEELLNEDGTGAWPIQGVWSIKQASWLEDINTGLGKADNLGKTDFANATKSLAANQTAYNAAKTAIDAVVAEANDLSTEQNGAMKAAFTAYAGVDAAYNTAANAEAVEAYYKAIGQAVPKAYTDLVSAAEKALQDLKDVIIANYSKQELDATDYAAALTAANTAVSNLQDWTTAIKPKLDAQDALNAFVKYLEDNQKILANDNIASDFLVKKFQSNIDALQQAVIAVTNESSSDNVVGSIGESQKLATSLINALQTAYDAYLNYHTQIEWLQKNCTANTLVDGSKYDVTALNNDIKAYLEQDEEWITTYERVADLDPQPCYEAATKLGGDIEKYDWKTKVTTTFATYINGLTKADYDFVENALNKIVAAIPTLNVPAPDKDGNETSPYLIAKKALENIKYQDAINLSSADKVAKLQACNTVIDELQTLWTNSVSGMYGNVTDYNDLKAQIEAQLGTPLSDLNTVIDGYSDSKAYATYQGWSNALKQSLDGRLTTLETRLKELSVTANKATTQAGIDADKAKNGETGSIAMDIKKNESAHDAELEASRGALAVIIQALAAIQENGGASEFATEWTDQLISLRDNDLVKADNDVAGAYKKGDCYAQNDDLIAAYDKIVADVNEIKASFNGGWDSLVAERNNSLLNGEDWKVSKLNMNAVYVDAINAFNGYVGLNDGYTETQAFKDVVTNNAGLFDYAADSRKLINQVTADVNAATDKGQALTDQEFKAIAFDKANAIIDKMKNAAATMIADFNEAGKAYYETLLPEAKQAMTDAAALLKGYGYTQTDIDGTLEKYNQTIEDQEEAYAEAKKVPATLYDEDGKLNYRATVGYAMGGIADALDGVIDYNLNSQVIKNDWDPYYKTFDFAALATELAKYKDITGIADIYNAQSVVFTTNKTNAEDLNKNIDNGNLLSDEDNNGKTLLQEKKEKLEGYYNAAKAAVDAVKLAAKNLETVTGFDTALTTANNSVSALKDIITLAGPAKANVSIKVAEDKVTVFNTTLGNFKNKKATEDQVKTAKSNAESAVNTALNAAYLAERNYLVGTDGEGGIINTLKVAYNDAYVVNSGVEEKYLASVDKCLADQVALPTVAGMITPAQYYANASDLENRIAALIVALQTVTTPEGQVVPALKEAIDSVDGQYDLSVDAVETAQTALESMNVKVQDEYASEYEGLLEELGNVKTAFDNAGDNRIVDANDYENQMAAIVAKIDGIKTNIATAEANATIYDNLYEDWEAVDAKVKALEAYANECEVSAIYTVELENIKAQCNAKLASLNELYAKRQLTASSSIDYSAIESSIELTDLKVSTSYGYVLSESTDGKIKEVQAWLNNLADNDIKLLPNAAGQNLSVADQLKTLSANLLKANEALGKFVPTDYDGNKVDEETGEPLTYSDGDEAIKAILDQFKTISDSVDELLKTAEDSSYQLGDLTNDGSINVADLVMMRKLILEKTSYNDLLTSDRRLAYAANIVGDNQINIADYTALVNIIVNSLTDDDEDAPATSMKKISRQSYYGVARSIEAEGSISIQAVAEENGVRTYAISISNPKTFVAGQLDLLVESTSRIVDVRGAERLENHDVDFQTDSQSTRVLISSFDNAEFEGTEGVTLYVDVEGRSGLGFENALFADATAQSYTFSNQAPVTTGVDSLFEGAKAVKEAVYDAAGRVMKSVQRGINIIRHSNGTVTKEIRK